MGDLAADAYQQLRPLAPHDPELGYPLANYLAAECAPDEEINTWVRDTDSGPGYSILLDIDRAPAKALAWLAQWKGVEIPDGLTDAEQRQWVKDAEGQHRGTKAALVKAGQRHLTGTKTIRIVERAGPTVYDVIVITRTSETPSVAIDDATSSIDSMPGSLDSTAPTLGDLKAAKRIGIRLTHLISDAPVIAEGTRTLNAATATIDAATVADVT